MPGQEGERAFIGSEILSDEKFVLDVPDQG